MHFMGFHGAAIATLLSQAVCLVFMVIYLKRKRLFSLHITCFDKADVLPLVPKAIPSVIQQSIQAVSTTFLTALVSTYSIIEIAAYGITGKLETILFYPAMALNMVLTAIIGQCIGGQRADRAKDYGLWRQGSIIILSVWSSPASCYTCSPARCWSLVPGKGKSWRTRRVLFLQIGHNIHSFSFI